MAVVKRQNIIKYAAILLMLLLASLTKVDNRMLPMSISFYAALVYCGQNIAIISPLYILSCLCNGLSTTTLIYALCPTVICIISKLIHKKIKKDLYILETIIYVVVSLLPLFAVYKSLDDKIILSISIVANAMTTYVCMSIFYAVFVRKTVFCLSIDEKACLYLTISLLSIGLAKLNIFSFEISLLIIGFVIEYCIHKNSIEISLCILLSIAFGYGIKNYNVASIAAVTITYLGSYCFKKINKYVSLISLVLIDLIMGIVFKCYVNYTYMHLVALFVGALAYVLLPNKVTNNFASLNFNKENICIDAILKRDKLETIKKLNIAESVIYELAGTYTNIGKSNFSREELIKRLANRVSMEVCQRCRNKEYCFKSLNISPEVAFHNAIDVFLISSKVGVNDLPVFLTSKCTSLDKILDKISCLTLAIKEKEAKEKQQSLENGFLALQMAGVGSVLGAISEELKNYPKSNKDIEEKIIAALGYQNIVCKEVLMFSSQSKISVIIAVRDIDKDKKEIEEILSKNFNVPLSKCDEEINKEDRMAYLYFESKCQYELAFYNIIVAKDGSKYCGDTQSIVKIKDSKILIVLCDGMGSGKNAQQTSSKTLELVQDFYRAGLDNSKALILVNRALACLNKETFTAVDMCVVDLNYGSVDFIKLGAVPCFIKKEEGIKIIESGALPLGIIESAKPNVSREVITTSDVIVMLSDGILDVLHVEGVKEILHRMDSKNPKIISEEIIGQAKIRGLKDDASIIVYKIYKKY